MGLAYIDFDFHPRSRLLFVVVPTSAVIPTYCLSPSVCLKPSMKWLQSINNEIT
jgi:hypothetical protein